MSFTPSSPRDSSIISTENISFSENNSQISEKDKFNSLEYQLPAPEDTNIYIFKKNLFIRTLLPIENNRNRKILMQCTQ